MRHVQMGQIVRAAVLAVAAGWPLGLKAASPQIDYDKEVKPILANYCMECHGSEKEKAGLRMDALDPDLINGNDAEMWQEVLDQVNISEMPPEEAKQPTRKERQRMVDWIAGELRKAEIAARSIGGNSIMRRLTVYEFNNTMRDLLDLDLDFAAGLPPEPSAKEGFKNNISVLATTALHLAYFEKNARNALETIINIPDDKPEKKSLSAEPEMILAGGKKKSKGTKPEYIQEFKAGRSYSGSVRHLNQGFKAAIARVSAVEVIKDRGVILVNNKTAKSSLELRFGKTAEPRVDYPSMNDPVANPMTIRIKAAAIQGKDGSYPGLSFLLKAKSNADQMEVANFEVQAPMSAPEVYELKARADEFTYLPQSLTVRNTFLPGTSDLSPDELPKVFVDSIEIVLHDNEVWPPKQHQAIFFPSENQSNEEEYIREVLARFMPKAFRRPVSKSEVEKYATFFERIRPTEESFHAAALPVLTAVLSSPHFLYHVEPNPSGLRKPLGDYELASRLSYFLWSTMPDDTLFSLAEKGQLKKPEILQAQLKRMMRDPRSSQFSKHFASQWFDLEAIRKVAVNPEYFKFQEATKDLFEAETIQFVDYVFRNNLSIANFVDSDFAILSPALAKHYGIEGVAGGSFAPVSLPKSDHRGGVLTHASMLLGNSDGGDTHPIKRGAWLLERLLDDPPPPPPANVPPLPEEAPNAKPTSLKEKLIQHAQMESCRDCHLKIDPWGVAFENYNAVGQWREGRSDPNALGEHKHVLSDPSTELENGKKIQNLDELKRYILTEKKGQFTKAVVNKALSYALGRYLGLADQESVSKIVSAVEKDGLRFQTLVEQVALSESFLTK